MARKRATNDGKTPSFHGNCGHREGARPRGTPRQRTHGLRPNGRQPPPPPAAPTPRPLPAIPHPTPAGAPGAARLSPPAGRRGREAGPGPRGGAPPLPPPRPRRGGAVRPRGPEEALPSTLAGGPARRLPPPPPPHKPRPGSPALGGAPRRSAGTTELITINHPRPHRGANGGRAGGGAGHGPDGAVGAPLSAAARLHPPRGCPCLPPPCPRVPPPGRSLAAAAAAARLSPALPGPGQKAH